MPELLFCSTPDFLYLSFVLSPGINEVIIIFNSATDTKKYATLQPKLFIIHPLLPLAGVLMIVGLILFSHVLTSTIAAASTAAATEMKDMELEDKMIRQELEPSETEEIEEEKEDDNTGKHEEKREEEEEQQSIDDTAGTGLEEDIMIDDNYSYDDDVPFDLPFDNIILFP
jgi:predicted nucleic acid-binding protein